jgi:hypothetical protein
MKPAIHFLKALGLAVLLFLQFYFLYSGKSNVLLYDETGVWLGLLIIMLTIPATIIAFSNVAFAQLENLKSGGLIMGVLSIIINGPFFGYWSGRHEAACYAKYGIKTWGTVSEAFYNSSSRMYYEFSVNDARYTSFNVRNPLRHATGDSVAVIYNSRCPTMNSAIENCEE